MNLSAYIASALSDMAPSRVDSIDSEINFNTAWLNTRGMARAKEVTDLRRLSILISRTVPNLAPMGPVDAKRATSWVEIELEQYIGCFSRTAPSRPNGAGMYLASSFWAYSSHSERAQARTAWTEALELIDAGCLAAGNLTDGDATRLCKKWFGEGGRHFVFETLNMTRTGMRTQRMALNYGGRGATGNPYAIQELGRTSAGTTGHVESLASPIAASNYTHNYINLNQPFFDPSTTTAQRTEEHSVHANRTEASRGGVILHEATHAYANTADVEIASGGGTAYGPQRCHHLATTLIQDPRRNATCNADNYRLFCEDAYVLRRRS